jgi:predicted patatin/cPLA2 family phospholipase
LSGKVLQVQTFGGRPAWEVLRARREAGSRPGQRRDDALVALVIEGGGNRASYSAGMAIALEQLGLVDCFDDVYGTSGGALNGAWMLTREGEKWLPSWATPEYAAQRVADARRLLGGRPVVDLHHLLHHVYVNVFPMDFAAILASPVRLHPIATDAATGASTDLAPYVTDQPTLQTALRATSALPLLAGRPVRLGGQAFVDGGVTEPVPFRTALAQGATHLLVLRTRRAEQRVEPSRAAQRLVMSGWFAAFAPGARAPYLRRDRIHLDDERELAAASPVVQQVRPPAGSPDVARLAKDLALVGSAIEIGREQLRSAFEQSRRG